jgi:L-iditol 2-dehydrogenase
MGFRLLDEKGVKSMKACVLHGVGDLTYETVKRPAPAAGEVLLHIRAAGICGSDIGRVFVKGTYTFPTIPGHEFAGQIVEVGEGVSSDLMGKKAAVFPLLPCKCCDMCEVGQYASCRSYDYFGSRRDGGFAEYIAVPVWNLVMGDQSLSYEEMAMAEPAAVSIHALAQGGGIALGERVAIFGAGAIGLMLAEFAQQSGAKQVILLDIDPAKIDFARQMGFADAINNGRSDWEKQVKDLTDGEGVHLAVEGAGVSASLAGCVRIARPKGRVVLMGNPAGDMGLSQLDYWEILRRQLSLHGTWNSNYTGEKNDWHTALWAMAAGRVRVARFITHRFSLCDGAQAFAMIRDKKEFSSRVMLVNE